ncbi:hypothetical protein K438DRAFT_1988264 [Mycena galopus ATCC 62051]|nr:hypothetical protein K438DRAFT_1988264 [Mycena galopus ATCC 62051]
MDKLPNELLDRICSFLERHDLRTVIQLSSSFRRLAMLPYLECFGISQANIQSGTLSISRSFFLIIIDEERDSLRTFAYSVGGHHPALDCEGFLHAPVASAILAADSMETASPPFGSLGLSTSMNFLVVMFGIPLLFAYLVSGVVNLAVLCMWVYRRVSKPPWSQEERIIEDTGLLLFDSWMRIQPLPHKHLTLVTLTDHRPGLSDSAYSAVLAALDLGTHLQELVVYRKANLVHSELLGLIPVVADPENKIKVLNAPSPYIPYLLPVAPNVHNISLLFSPAAHRLPPYGPRSSASRPLLPLPRRLPPLGRPPDAEAIDCTAFPEARSRASRPSSSAATARALLRGRHPDAVRWLALFPGLQRLMFAYGAVEQIPVPSALRWRS